MKIRIKFSKTGTMKFIGHLDLIRLFQKIFKTSNLPIAFSSGFNPHPIMSIGAPLSVGVTSSSEYMDIKLATDIKIEESIAALNKYIPDGLEILDITILEDKSESAMALIDAAKYKVSSRNEAKINAEHIKAFMSQAEIIIEKKTKKKKIKHIDIKPGILNIVMQDNKQMIMLLATGSRMNVKPDIVLKSICEFNELVYNPFDYAIHRDDLYYRKGIDLIPLNQDL